MEKVKRWMKKEAKKVKEKAEKMEGKFKDIFKSTKNKKECEVRQPGEKVQVSVKDVQQKYPKPDEAHKKKIHKIKDVVKAIFLPCVTDAYGKSAGKLPKDHYKRVRENYVFLLDNIDGKILTPFLFQCGAFDYDDMEEVYEGKTKRQRSEIFTNKLLYSGEFGYNIFMHALIGKGYYDVIEKLECITIE